MKIIKSFALWAAYSMVGISLWNSWHTEHQVVESLVQKTRQLDGELVGKAAATSLLCANDTLSNTSFSLAEAEATAAAAVAKARAAQAKAEARVEAAEARAEAAEARAEAAEARALVEELPTTKQSTLVRPEADSTTSTPADSAPSKSTMAACLLLMDDTIKLREWLAYHYTVLPLGDLIVAIDPHSVHPEKMVSVLNAWKGRMNITIWTNDTWMAEVGPHEGWGRVRKHNFSIPISAHRRRQNLFTHFCMQELKRQGKEWVLHLDSDEFLVYNYRHNDTEDWESFAAQKRGYRQHHIEEARAKNVPIRDMLPPLSLVQPVATFLNSHNHEQLNRCLRIPSLDFGTMESPAEEIQKDVPAGIDPMHLMTLRHRKHGKGNNKFSKVIINLAKVPDTMIDFKFVETIHNPSTRICGSNGGTTSGTDYIASILRINHYAGTKEAYFERKKDSRGRKGDQSQNNTRLDTYYKNKNELAKPHIPNDDVRPWISLFIEKIGLQEANRLLGTLHEAYSARILPSDSAVNASAAAIATGETVSEPSVVNQEAKRRAGIQMDIMVPASGIDERLKHFSKRLGTAIADYSNSTSPQTYTRISAFRLLITRFTPEEKAQSAAFQAELANSTGLALDQVILVHSPANKNFSRAGAMNLLHKAACHLESCLVASMDVDMTLKKEFFEHSVDIVLLQKNIAPPPKKIKRTSQNSIMRDSWKLKNGTPPTAYFPIVWSTFNPQSIQLVQEHLNQTSPLPEYSPHRGIWRDNGTGMYVLRGSDAATFELDTSYQGWGGEDGDFYIRVARHRRIVRQNEKGLIHVWHSKSCKVGVELTKAMLGACRAARNKYESSELGKQLLQARGLFPPKD